MSRRRTERSPRIQTTAKHTRNSSQGLAVSGGCCPNRDFRNLADFGLLMRFENYILSAPERGTWVSPRRQPWVESTAEKGSPEWTIPYSDSPQGFFDMPGVALTGLQSRRLVFPGFRFAPPCAYSFRSFRALIGTTKASGNSPSGLKVSRSWKSLLANRPSKISSVLGVSMSNHGEAVGSR